MKIWTIWNGLVFHFSQFQTWKRAKYHVNISPNLISRKIRICGRKFLRFPHNANFWLSNFRGLFIFETLYVDVSFLPFVNGSERRWKNFHVSKQRFGQHLIFKIILIHDFFNKVCSRQVLVLNKSRCWLLLFRMGRKGEGGAQDVCWCFFAQCENLWLFCRSDFTWNQFLGLLKSKN